MQRPSNIIHYESGADPELFALYILGLMIGWFILRCICGPKIKPYEYSDRGDAGKC